jgi:importin subunit beta-1
MCHDFSGKAIGKIVPALLWVLTKQDEDEDEDEWTPLMSSATCLSLLAQCVRDAIINPIVPFVESNINNGDWRYRAAAVMAFGSIMDGPPTNFLAPLVDQVRIMMMMMMTALITHSLIIGTSYPYDYDARSCGQCQRCGGVDPWACV